MMREGKKKEEILPAYILLLFTSLNESTTSVLVQLKQ